MAAESPESPEDLEGANRVTKKKRVSNGREVLVGVEYEGFHGVFVVPEEPDDVALDDFAETVWDELEEVAYGDPLVIEEGEDDE